LNELVSNVLLSSCAELTERLVDLLLNDLLFYSLLCAECLAAFDTHTRLRHLSLKVHILLVEARLYLFLDEVSIIFVKLLLHNLQRSLLEEIFNSGRIFVLEYYFLAQALLSPHMLCFHEA